MNNASIPNIKQLFAEALRDPNAVSDVDFQLLFSEYPFAQALVFAYQCRRSTAADSGVHGAVQKALLHTDNRYWLYDLVEQRVDDTADESFVEQEQIEPIAVEEKIVATAVHIAEVDTKIVNDELADLIFEQAQSVDYFALEKSTEVEAQSEDATAAAPVEIGAKDEDGEEDLSVYDDALMPYSFRWWLYKTRLKHADTYQPFVNFQSLTTRADGQYVPSKFDETILDHQIRENIFHLQDPEDKLSAAIRQKTVEVSMPKKTDAVIERFIREEPQIQPPTPDVVNNENKARKSAEDHFSLVTETLANIYIEQGLYPKAADVFRKLISINPEKKAYFASRIEELEQKF